MKDLNIVDNLKTTDSTGARPQSKNCFDIYRGDTKIYRGFNVVVDKGRMLNLQNIFKLATDPTLSLHTTPFLYVSCFSIGDGAAAPESLSTPILPAITDTGLFRQVNFYSADLARANEDADTSKPKYWSASKYKNFSDIKMVHDVATNEMYAEITLKIGTSEAVGKNINEVGLYMAEHNINGTTKTNFKLFSKFTFASLPNSEFEGRDEYTIKYHVYV